MSDQQNPQQRQWWVLFMGIPSIVALIGIWWSLQDRTVSEGEYRGERTAEISEYARRLTKVEEELDSRQSYISRLQAVEIELRFTREDLANTKVELARRLEGLSSFVKDVRDEMRQQRE